MYFEVGIWASVEGGGGGGLPRSGCSLGILDCYSRRHVRIVLNHVAVHNIPFIFRSRQKASFVVTQSFTHSQRSSDNKSRNNKAGII